MYDASLYSMGIVPFGTDNCPFLPPFRHSRPVIMNQTYLRAFVPADPIVVGE